MNTKSLRIAGSILVVLIIVALTYKLFSNLESIKLLGLSIYDWLNKQNPMIAGAISLWALGSITYITRSVPQKLWEIVLKQSTVSLVMNNEDMIYTHFLIWYHETGRSKTSRTLLAKNFWNDDADREELNISAGYGTHFFTFEGKIFKFHRDLKDTTMNKTVKESLTLTTIGRSQKQFHELIKVIVPETKEKNMTSICQWVPTEKYWKSYSEQPVRRFNSVILPQETKDSIIGHIDTFLSNREWYLEKGIPYRTGLIFHGIPGTGKTSLARALCEKYNKPLHTLSLSGMSDKSLEQALSALPKNAILLMEDIDTYSVTSKRGAENEDNDGSIEEIMSLLTLSGLLNAIDGIISSDGRILIATTNHIEKLDSALVRKGRFNLNIEIGYLTSECFKEFFRQFFPEFNLPENVDFKKNIPPSDLQALIIDNLDKPQKVLDFCLENK